MSMYRKEWDCCGSVTETESWEPEECPFCSTPHLTAQSNALPKEQPALSDEQIIGLLKEHGVVTSDMTTRRTDNLHNLFDFARAILLAAQGGKP